MSRVLFVSVDAGGNLPPALALAHSLASQGHELAFAGSPGQRGRVGGLDFRALPTLDSWPEPTAPASAVATVRKYTRLAASRRLAAEVGTAVREWSADAVVVDCMMPSSARAAEESGARTAILFHSLLSFWTGPWLHGPVGGIARLMGTDAARIWSAADARLVASARELDTGTLPDTRWIGTTEHGTVAPTADPPRILLSFSSIYYPGQLAAYRSVIAALGTLPVRAVVTMGSGDPNGFDAPPNVEVRGYADHSELMPGAALVITHGGHSTTLKALAHGVPVLVAPMHPALDQPLVGAAVARAGLGAVVSRKSGPPEFAAAIGRVLADPGYAAAARAFAERVRATDAAADASAAILGPLRSALP